MSDSMETVFMAAARYCKAWMVVMDPHTPDHDIDGSELPEMSLEELEEDAKHNREHISVEVLEAADAYRALVRAVRDAEEDPFIESTPDIRTN